jgi:hypothetical protein
VNRWVCDGHGFDAATTMAMVRRFALQSVPGHAHEQACTWITACVRLYEPLIERLLAARDSRLARRAGAPREALDD